MRKKRKKKFFWIQLAPDLYSCCGFLIEFQKNKCKKRFVGKTIANFASVPVGCRENALYVG
jgi:hypothetical protein